MTDAGSNAEKFDALIRGGDFRGAIASVMGQNPVGIERARRLLLEHHKLEAVHQEAVMGWSSLPLAPLPIGEQRWYVEELARHEMAHIVVAKAVGFSTGEVTLVLNSPDGSHQGTSEIFLDFPTSSLAEIGSYLDRRAIVLLAGYLAESADGHKRRACVSQKMMQRKASESDLQKALELIRIKLNIEMNFHPDSLSVMLNALAGRTSQIVETNFRVISSLARKLADRINFFEQRIGWERCEIDIQPEIRDIVKAFIGGQIPISR